MGGDKKQTTKSNFRQACRNIVQGLAERYEWALLQQNDLVDLVLGSIPSNALPTQIEKLAKHHYTIALYQACRQSKNPERRERAYYELHRYLYRAAFNRRPELAEDAAQQALILVFEQIDRCREPGAFLAFALYKLLHAFQQIQPKGDNESSWEETSQVDIKSVSAKLSS